MRQDFVHRTLASAVGDLSKRFGVVLVTGPRQVGKTTLLQRIRSQHPRTYVTLDDTEAKALAKKDPAGFLQRYEPPVLIDEVQYAPQLFPHIKMVADKSRKPGLFWLTGSQQFEMMRHVSESLAGRVAVVKLLGFSAFEEACKARQAVPFLPMLSQLQRREKTMKPCSMMQLYHRIWRGSFPFAVASQERDLEQFYSSYTATYLQRDVRDYAQIHNTTRFFTFLRMAAARSGQLVNYADFARDLGVSQPTVKSWLAVLQACGLVYLLRPYFSNQTKRLLKTPKLYFLDTGLCAHLAGWSSPRVLERGAMAGAILETYVVTEILKSYWHTGREPRIFFYRDKEKREIDVILEENGTLYPIEIKKTATPNPRDTRHFAVLDRLGIPVGSGGLVCLRQSHIPLAPNIHAVPVGYL